LGRRDIYVSVSALDFAGNESPRTDPIRIHTGSGGCAASKGTHRGWFDAGWLVLACLLCLRRRRRPAPR
jgi:hypothetical protein